MTSAQRTNITSDLSMSDIDLRGDEPRLSHKRLALALGMSQHHKLRHLIERNIVEFQRYGEVSSTVDGTSSQGGRPGKVVLLNEGQAILASVRSDAPKAPDVRYQVITAFMAWRRAQAEVQQPTIPVKAHERRPSTKLDNAISLARSADRLEAVASRIQPQQVSLAWVGGTPVPYDATDYMVHNAEAVVMYQDGRMAVEVVEYRHGDSPRAGYTKPKPWSHGGTMRMGVTILGRVMHRAVPPGAVQTVTRHGPKPVYRDAILAALEQGLTARQAAEQTGASIHTVRDWQRKRRLLAA